MALNDTIQQLVDYCCARGLIGAEDRAWAYNTVLDCAWAKGPAPSEAWVLAVNVGEPRDFDLEAALLAIGDAAVANGAEANTASGHDRIAMRVMGALMPKPSEVAAKFNERIEAGDPRGATDEFYRLSCDAGYVRRAAIARNVKWETATEWGDLEITINLSKPEKDPREIAAAGAAKDDGEKYPSCQLCIQNEGYPGRGASAAGGAHPARQNLRIVPIELAGERWGLQYSPYAYFNEHCIAMSSVHRPMHIDRSALEHLLDFVDLLPHYFIGSNADLPIVGGSILSHDHYQGGDHEFPMMRSEVTDTFAMAAYPDVAGEVLKWPMSVLRLVSENREQLLEAAVHTIDAWRAWSDESVGVRAHDDDGTPHNTVTPVVRRRGDGYECYLTLRCNVTSDENPLGDFHPHAQWHHIKRENIGLIEVMGLAILPARLVKELEAVRGHLLAGEPEALESDPLSASHATWARKVATAHPELNANNATEILHREVGRVFGHVLEDAGVFKWDENGRAAQRRFTDSL
jgi:UDPglucose--hexose-1-phosphate uridylyltransferase